MYALVSLSLSLSLSLFLSFFLSLSQSPSLSVARARARHLTGPRSRLLSPPLTEHKESATRQT